MHSRGLYHGSRRRCHCRGVDIRGRGGCGRARKASTGGGGERHAWTSVRVETANLFGRRVVEGGARWKAWTAARRAKLLLLCGSNR